MRLHLLKRPTLVKDPHLNLPSKFVPMDLPMGPHRNHPDKFNRSQILQYPQYPHQV